MGNYWIASQQGLYIVSKGKMGEISQKLLFHDPENPYSFISLYKDLNGNIWAGTYGYGVFKINPITLEIINFNSKNGLSNDNIIHISGNQENIWLSTLGGGVTKYCTQNTDEFKTYTTKEGLTSDYVYSTSPILRTELGLLQMEVVLFIIKMIVFINSQIQSLIQLKRQFFQLLKIAIVIFGSIVQTMDYLDIVEKLSLITMKKMD
jgi:hypothetical protein